MRGCQCYLTNPQLKFWYGLSPDTTFVTPWEQQFIVEMKLARLAVHWTHCSRIYDWDF